MDRRRLFGYLCLTGFLVMIGLCWFSEDRYSSVRISMPGGTASVRGQLFDGTAAIGVNPTWGFNGSWFMGNQFSLRDLDPMLAGYYRKSFDWAGRIGFGKEYTLVGTGKIIASRHACHNVYLPLWLTYLLFVVVTFLLLRPTRKQRLLEEQGASPSNSPPGE